MRHAALTRAGVGERAAATTADGGTMAPATVQTAPSRSSGDVIGGDFIRVHTGVMSNW